MKRSEAAHFNRIVKQNPTLKCVEILKHQFAKLDGDALNRARVESCMKERSSDVYWLKKGWKKIKFCNAKNMWTNNRLVFSKINCIQHDQLY